MPAWPVSKVRRTSADCSADWSWTTGHTGYRHAVPAVLLCFDVPAQLWRLLGGRLTDEEKADAGD